MANKNEKVVNNSFTKQFIDNINSIVLNKAVDVNTIPNFSGSARYNGSYYSAGTAVAFNNPPAIPSNDLDSIASAINEESKLSNIGGTGSKVKGELIYTTLCDIVKRLTRVRNFTSKWYHKTQGSYALVASSSGKAVFKETLPPIQGTANIANNSITSGWERSINGTTIQNVAIPNSGISDHKSILAEGLNNFFTTLNETWIAASNSPINYTFYSCHNNCHSNCHSSCHSSCHDNCYTVPCYTPVPPPCYTAPPPPCYVPACYTNCHNSCHGSGRARR